MGVKGAELTVENCPKIGKYREKVTKKRTKQEGSFTLPLMTDRAGYTTVADADIGSLKSLHTLCDKYLDHMLVEFEQNCIV